MINTLTMLSLFFLLKISLAFAPHKIKKWPGQPDLPKFGQYGGHITVNTTSGKKFYYLFTESPQQPERKPLVLWLNGGMLFSPHFLKILIVWAVSNTLA